LTKSHHLTQVRCHPRNNDNNATSQLTKENHVTITGLRQRTEYGFAVRAKTTHGWGDFSPTIFKTTGQVLGEWDNFLCHIRSVFLQHVSMICFSLAYVGDDDNMQVRIIAGATVAVVVLLVIIIIMTVLFLRRYVRSP